MTDIAQALATPGDRLAINCHGCGMMRLLPAEVGVGEVFILPVCLKCSTSPLALQLREDGVYELSPAEFRAYLDKTHAAQAL